MASFTKAMHTDEAQLWEQVVTHPFIIKLGNNQLPESAFSQYFTQDYACVEALVKVVGHAITKAPSMADVEPLLPILGSLVNAEHYFFEQVFETMNVPPEEYLYPRLLPGVQAGIDYMTRISERGQFDEICTLLLVTQWTCSDFATRMVKSGSLPEDPVRRRWVRLHADTAKAATVINLRDQLDSVEQSCQQRCRDVFHKMLEYRLVNWECAFRAA